MFCLAHVRTDCEKVVHLLQSNASLVPDDDGPLYRKFFNHILEYLKMEQDELEAGINEADVHDEVEKNVLGWYNRYVPVY